jgi:hypothetical protein
MTPIDQQQRPAGRSTRGHPLSMDVAYVRTVVVLLIAPPERLHDAEGAVGLERHGRQLRRVVRRCAGGHAATEAVRGGGGRSDGREEEAMLLLLMLLELVLVHVRRQREA